MLKKRGKVGKRQYVFVGLPGRQLGQSDQSQSSVSSVAKQAEMKKAPTTGKKTNRLAEEKLTLRPKAVRVGKQGKLKLQKKTKPLKGKGGKRSR